MRVLFKISLSLLTSLNNHTIFFIKDTRTNINVLVQDRLSDLLSTIYGIFMDSKPFILIENVNLRKFEMCSDTTKSHTQ